MYLNDHYNIQLFFITKICHKNFLTIKVQKGIKMELGENKQKLSEFHLAHMINVRKK